VADQRRHVAQPAVQLAALAGDRQRFGLRVLRQCPGDRPCAELWDNTTGLHPYLESDASLVIPNHFHAVFTLTREGFLRSVNVLRPPTRGTNPARTALRRSQRARLPISGFRCPLGKAGRVRKEGVARCAPPRLDLPVQGMSS
jgi:hypothetical protein